MAEVDVSRAMKSLFSFFDPYKSGSISAPQVQLLHEEIRVGGISMPQVLASIQFKNLNKNAVYLSDLPDLLQEMDRRYFLVQDLQWEFAMLDRSHIGKIPIDTARFFMEARHGVSFSERSWERLLCSRPVPGAPISFAEMEVALCDVMEADWRDRAREVEEKPKLKNKAEMNTRESRLKMENEQKRKHEATRQNEENQRKLEAEKREREKTQKDLEEERRIAEERERNARDAESKTQEAEEEEKRARQQEKMLLDAVKKQQDAKKKEQAEQAAKEAAKKVDAARRKRIRSQLKVAVESRNRDKLTKSVKEFKEEQMSDDDGELAKAERLLKMFQCSDDLKDAMSKRLVKELENSIAKARRNGFDKDELFDLTAQADELLTRLRRLERLRHEILELKSSTIAEIRSYQKPPAIVHDVMMATYLLLGTPFNETRKWPNVQVLLSKTGRESLKRRISKLSVSDINVPTATKAKDQMGDIDLEMIRDVSAGAATFFVWVHCCGWCTSNQVGGTSLVRLPDNFPADCVGWKSARSREWWKKCSHPTCEKMHFVTSNFSFAFCNLFHASLTYL